jgi:general secretion pathway protein F
MPLYQYQALDRQGRKLSGTTEGQTEKEIKDRLREQGLMVSKIGIKDLSSTNSLKGTNLLTFTTQLAQLVSSGIPVYESLVAIEEQARKEKYHYILVSMCEQIKKGRTLSSAMGEHPASFDKLYCSMIAAGEAVGALDVVLEKLSFLLKRQIKLSKEITTAMIYPGILAVFAVAVIFAMLGFVVPSIKGIFADRPLNGWTQFVVGLSDLFVNYWWLLFTGLIGGIAFAVIKLRSPSGRLWIQQNVLKVPVLNILTIQIAVARFCRTMGTLQLGGLSMIDSLRIAQGVMGNVVLEKEIQAAEDKIVQGSSLSAQLSQSTLIPPMVSRMIAIGEESGNMANMLSKVADMYEEEVEKTLTRGLALVQPIILVVMGGIIGLVMIAILIPLTDLTSLTGG